MKSPIAAQLPSPTKIPVAIPPPDYWQANPSWRISMLKMIDPYGWHKIDKRTLDRIRQRLSNFETMTWSDILVVGKKRHHTVSIDRISAEAKKHLRELRQYDIDELVSLSLTGLERIWGIRQGSILRLLWWDPNHLICPSLRKHT